MNLIEFEKKYKELIPVNYKTKDHDNFSKYLIKNNIDVSCLKEQVKENNSYNRIYFQVSLAYCNSIEEKLEFIENNEELLNDWWHVDQLTQFCDKYLNLDIAYQKAKKYVESPLTFTRRWGYVMFMPSLVKQEEAFDLIISLLKNDDEYYVVMAEAWLISYLAIYHPDKTYEYLLNCDLKYNIVGRAIQKIYDSFRISEDYKNKFKKLREKYK